MGLQQQSSMQWQVCYNRVHTPQSINVQQQEGAWGRRAGCSSGHGMEKSARWIKAALRAPTQLHTRWWPPHGQGQGVPASQSAALQVI